jgi:thiol-disulfide isomerase/thioredoxin
MWPRVSIVAGLVAGMAVASLVLGAIVLLGPPPTVPVAAATPPPSPVASASAGEGPSSAPSVAAGASASAAPSGSASPAASASGASCVPAAPSPDASAVVSPSAAAGFHIGEPAPALTLPKVGGGTVDLAGMSGTPIWLNFINTECPASQEGLPLMSGFASRYADAGLVVVAVDVRESEATADAFAKLLGASFPIALDQDGSAAARWGATELPVHYWIDAEGIVRDAALGGIGPDIMARGLTTILPGVDVQP